MTAENDAITRLQMALERSHRFSDDPVMQELIRDYRRIDLLISRHFGAPDAFLSDLIVSREGLRCEIEQRLDELKTATNPACHNTMQE